MILDLNIPGGGIEALRQIVVEFPSVRCIILTVCDSAHTAIDALNAGAQGYVLKGVSAADLKSAVWTAFTNGSFVSPEIATKLGDLFVIGPHFKHSNFAGTFMSEMGHKSRLVRRSD